MKWTSKKLSDYIKEEINKKSRLTLQEGDFSKQNKEAIEAISKGVSYGHNEWQNDVRINNVFVSGGTCSALGPLTSFATGVANIGCISGRINNNTIIDKISSFLPGKRIVNLDKYLLSLIISISNAFSKIYNNWLSELQINNIKVINGFCSCQAPPSSTVGSFSNGIGSLETLSGNISIKLNKKDLKDEALQQLKSYLLLNEGSYSKPLFQYVESITNGIISMQNEWIIDTKIDQLKVNGGISIFLGPITSSVGKDGKFI
jgi:hypothetical protein